jgi:hypothetical protein
MDGSRHTLSSGDRGYDFVTAVAKPSGLPSGSPIGEGRSTDHFLAVSQYKVVLRPLSFSALAMKFTSRRKALCK